MIPRVNRMPPKKLQPSNLRAAFFGRIVTLFLQGEVLFLKFGIKDVMFSVVVLVITSVVVVIVVVLLIASVVASVTGFILIVVVELFEDKNRSL